MSRIFYGWWVVLACAGVSFCVGGVVTSGFTAFFGPIQAELGWSYTQISFAASLRGFEMGLFAPLVGFLVYRFGSRLLMLSGTLAIGAGLLVLSITQSLPTFYGAFMIVALGAGGCTSLVTMSVVANWFQRHVGIALGIMASGFGLGGLVVPLIIFLIDSYGWRTTLGILGLGIWAVGIPLSLLVRNSPEGYGLCPDGKEPQKDTGTARDASSSPEVTLQEAFRNKAFWYLNIAEGIRFMAMTAIATHVIPFLTSLGYRRAFSGVVAGAIPLISIVGRFGLGYLADRFEKRVVMATAFVLVGLGLLTFANVQRPWLIYVFLCLYPPGFGGGMVLRGAILRETFGRASFAKLMGIVMGSAAVGGTIGPTVAGLAFDKLGTYQPIWYILFVLTILMAFLSLRIK